jgi:3-dehydroquinate dehydratase type I
MRSVSLGGLVVGEVPVLLGTALAPSVAEMLDGVERARAAGADCVELRIDRLPKIEDVVELIDAAGFPHIVACRTPQFGGFFEASESERIERLEAASRAGAAAVDIEFFTEPALRHRLISAAREDGTPVLVGYENMQETPPLETLIEGIEAVAALGPDLVKLAVRAESHEDLLTVLSAALRMREILDVPFAAIALGPHGAPSRPIALALGASFTYCAVETGGAPGQLTVAETREVLETVSAERWSCSSS